MEMRGMMDHVRKDDAVARGQRQRAAGHERCGATSVPVAPEGDGTDAGSSERRVHITPGPAGRQLVTK